MGEGAVGLGQRGTLGTRLVIHTCVDGKRERGRGLEGVGRGYATVWRKCEGGMPHFAVIFMPCDTSEGPEVERGLRSHPWLHPWSHPGPHISADVFKGRGATPTSCSDVRVTTASSETAQRELSASPRNPNVCRLWGAHGWRSARGSLTFTRSFTRSFMQPLTDKSANSLIFDVWYLRVSA